MKLTEHTKSSIMLLISTFLSWSPKFTARKPVLPAGNWLHSTNYRTCGNRVLLAPPHEGNHSGRLPFYNWRTQRVCTITPVMYGGYSLVWKTRAHQYTARTATGKSMYIPNCYTVMVVQETLQNILADHRDEWPIGMSLYVVQHDNRCCIPD